eukprot:74600-Prorocentrum_lima.AAC.1
MTREVTSNGPYDKDVNVVIQQSFATISCVCSHCVCCFPLNPNGTVPDQTNPREIKGLEEPIGSMVFVIVLSP